MTRRCAAKLGNVRLAGLDTELVMFTPLIITYNVSMAKGRTFHEVDLHLKEQMMNACTHA